ncbi:MAG: ATP-binding protein [Lachnospiraceae bacterium]|nr:ATP-binding protein [Lachnospiraceae bacterium]
MKEIEVEAKVEKLEEVLSFVDELLSVYDCPMKTQIQIDVAVEEIFVNIAHYAYGEDTGMAVVSAEVSGDPRCLSITFSDSGVPYDPLKKEDPDITLNAEERQIGGLGIYMVKQSMDAVDYKYENGKNIFTIKKFLN